MEAEVFGVVAVQPIVFPLENLSPVAACEDELDLGVLAE
jgi:hypothetical protein